MLRQRNGKRTIPSITRRGLMELLAAGLSLPSAVRASARDDVLVLGMDLGETVTYDPAVGTGYTQPIVFEATYDTLVSMNADEYTTIKPALASSWRRTADGNGWSFTLRSGARFNSGNPVTADDVKWSFDRVIHMGQQASQYLTNVVETRAPAPDQFEITLRDPAQPILDILCAPSFIVYERKALEQHGGVSSADAPAKDQATDWLNQHSCGSGPYTLTGWQRNIATHLEANPYYWRGPVAFKRVVILHMSDPATQLLAIQRGTIDAAFNLVPEQINALRSNSDVRIDRLQSLDFVYLLLSSNPEFNKTLAIKQAREAIGYAIDYDGIRNNLLGGAAVRSASFLPVGVLGATEKVTADVGFHQDYAKARGLLQKAGLPDGFSFKLSYGTQLIAGVSYATIAQKIQADLAEVGIKAELDPLDPVTLRTQYNSGKSTSVVIFWNPPAVDNWLWAAATVQRVAKRAHWDPPADIVALVDQAAKEPDEQEQAALWVEYQKRMVDQANLIVLFQPIYQIAVRNRIKSLPLTASGWQVDLYAAQ
jgi:peptide/nickel transport system substrate-binding protein